MQELSKNRFVLDKDMIEVEPLTKEQLKKREEINKKVAEYLKGEK